MLAQSGRATKRLNRRSQVRVLYVPPVHNMFCIVGHIKITYAQGFKELYNLKQQGVKQ